MMGASHAATGAAGAVLVAGSYQVPLGWASEMFNIGWLPEYAQLGFGLIPGISDFWVTMFIILWAGGAMWPDADQRQSTVGYAFPPVSFWICDFVENVSGGHRNGTHSFIGIIAFAAVTWGLAWVDSLIGLSLPVVGDVQILTGIFAVVTAAIALKVLRFLPKETRKSHWLVGGIIGVLVALIPADEAWWLPLSIAGGAAIHIAGDALTTQKVNMFYPAVIKPPKVLHVIPFIGWFWDKDNGRHGIPILGTAGSTREWLFTLVLVTPIAVAGLAMSMLGASVEAFELVQGAWD